MSVERKEELVYQENGVTYVKNTFVDSERKFSRKEARKRKGMLDTYSIESQMNIMRKAILKIAESGNVDVSELQSIEDLATDLGIQ